MAKLNGPQVVEDHGAAPRMKKRRTDMKTAERRKVTSIFCRYYRQRKGERHWDRVSGVRESKQPGRSLFAASDEKPAREALTCRRGRRYKQNTRNWP